MKKYILFIAATAFINNAMAQSTSDILKQQAGEGVKQGATIATEHTADKAADKILGKLFGGKKDKKKKKEDDNNNNNSANTPSTSNNSNVSADRSAATGSFQTYSKFDFVPGDKVLVDEDFSQDNIGDFPDKWNTNSSGEVVTVEGMAGHWLEIKKPGLFVPEFITNLPDNFTLQFDLLVNPDFHPYSNPVRLFIMDGDKGKRDFDGTYIFQTTRSGVLFSFWPQDASSNPSPAEIRFNNFENGQKMLNNQMTTAQFAATGGKNLVKISIWRQKQRIRMYMNEDKLVDAPRALLPGKNYQNIAFQIEFPLKENDRYLVGNIRLAVGNPDTRNKLITEGKFSTTGILFDVNSANIKPESYGAIKDIADVLQDNANVHVKIIGHTDSDGHASANLALSKKRADAVKSILISEFKIDASRMETDGKGASDPVADNKTSAGKAQNRRVEFVKL